MDCPDCNLINPDRAQRCGRGYDFVDALWTAGGVFGFLANLDTKG